MINLSQIKFLDCTLRDGGQLFETLHYETRAGLSIVPIFDSPLKIANQLFRVGLDMVEIGVINEDGSFNVGVSVYNYLPSNLFSSITKSENQQLAILFKGPNFNLDLIPNTDITITITRVVIRYSQLSESLKFCNELRDKGYKVSIQLMLTSRYTLNEINKIIDFANENDLYALYIVDSYGYMDYEELNYFFNIFDSKLINSIKIGIHLHNNNGLALSNTIRIIREVDTKRDIIIDSSLMGLGLGAGNLKTEEILLWFKDDYRFSYADLMTSAEEIEKYIHSNAWGYSLVQLLSAHFRLAYKYSEYMRYKKNLSYRIIYRVLSEIRGEKLHLFDREYCDLLIREYENV